MTDDLKPQQQTTDHMLCGDGQPCADPEGCDANYCARETGRKFSEHFNAWLAAKREKENQHGQS